MPVLSHWRRMMADFPSVVDKLTISHQATPLGTRNYFHWIRRALIRRKLEISTSVIKKDFFFIFSQVKWSRKKNVWIECVIGNKSETTWRGLVDWGPADDGGRAIGFSEWHDDDVRKKKKKVLDQLGYKGKRKAGRLRLYIISNREGKFEKKKSQTTERMAALIHPFRQVPAPPSARAEFFKKKKENKKERKDSPVW